MYEVHKAGILKKLETWQIIIPRHDNDGNNFEDAEIHDILDKITLTFPGFTLINCTGYWRGEDQVFVDDNLQLTIDVLPSPAARTIDFFDGLKQELQLRLKQEKIYVTREASKEEFISFDEFFEEVGIDPNVASTALDKRHLATQLNARLDLVLQRLSYETTALRRNTETKKIIWERRVCGITIKSVIDDVYPPSVRLLAADQIQPLSRVFDTGNYAIIGHYEFQSFAIEKLPFRPLVRTILVEDSNIEAAQYLTPLGKVIPAKHFVEEFTMAIAANYMVLRDEGFLENEITISVGADGSLQIGDGQPGKQMFLCPASIPDTATVNEILRCVGEACDLIEKSEADGVSVQQAKAKNNYILKRAIIRRSLQSGMTR